ncbi:leucine-rich repeat-containing protein 74B isoform X2 [Polyergus mexicanus]|uniref:leucine-rich repeat-containing protein 74B isoform X2 n=1 Tax=Polyergus mexicanus TaxID=615972 RepID=UPI0038B57CC8
MAKWQMDWHFRTFRKYARRDRQQPVFYTNFLLRCFVHSVAVCLRNSLMITSLALDGIPLAANYLRILSDGLANNRNLRSLSLARCRIGDTGCYILLESLQHNSNLHTLDLSSCCLTNRSATYLSLFLKKRKADLLQNIWKEVTLSRENAEGLRVLILDKNYKFGDIGLRQLTRMLKNDIWLKTLRLRYCGITQHGGAIVLKLLQTNTVLIHIDLRDNEMSIDISQNIRKILKKRRSKREEISIKKKLLNCEHISIHLIPKTAVFQCTSKENRFSGNQNHPQSRIRRSILQIHAQKARRKNYKKCKLQNIIKKSHVRWANADKLKKHMSFMIERNQNLIRILENKTDLLIKERDRRLSYEEAYHKIQPQLRNLKNKIDMQNYIYSNMCYEKQVYANLQNAFNELKISMQGKVIKMDEKNSEEKACENQN